MLGNKKILLGNIRKNLCSVTSARPLWKISGVRPLTGTLLDGATRKDWTTAVYMNYTAILEALYLAVYQLLSIISKKTKALNIYLIVIPTI